MTWELQGPVSDDIHRVMNRQGRTLWAVDHHGFDTDHPEALGAAEVDLPTGTASLLLVKPLAGGLILDTVRSYQGLVEGELCTLFLGIIDELRTSSDAQSRICLESIGLDATGRPRIIPGISRTSPSSTRFAIGEMLYHAAYGRPWEQSPLPVSIALPDCSAALQALVAQLLDETATDTGLHDTLDEVSAALRRTGTASALPLLPAERDLDPGHALTARLRAAKTLTAPSIPETTAPETPAGVRRTAQSPKNSNAAAVMSAAGRLRAASREGVRSRSQRRREERVPLLTRLASSLTAGCRSLAQSLPTMGRRPRVRPPGPRTWVLLAVVLTVLGGAVMVRSWNSGETAASMSSSPNVSPASGEDPAGRQSDPPSGAEGMSERQVIDVLKELCQKRATALRDGDEQALAALTVPDSAAAAADELLNLQDFVGHDYMIDVDDPVITEQTDQRILITAHMSTSVSVEGEESAFVPSFVEFELVVHEGKWRILTVTELGR